MHDDAGITPTQSTVDSVLTAMNNKTQKSTGLSYLNITSSGEIGLIGRLSTYATIAWGALGQTGKWDNGGSWASTKAGAIGIHTYNASSSPSGVHYFYQPNGSSNFYNPYTGSYTTSPGTLATGGENYIWLNQ